MLRLPLPEFSLIGSQNSRKERRTLPSAINNGKRSEEENPKAPPRHAVVVLHLAVAVFYGLPLDLNGISKYKAGFGRSLDDGICLDRIAILIKGKIAGDQIIKLMTLGLTEQEAEEQIIGGFLR